MSQRDDLDIPVISAVGVICVALTVATIYAMQALYFNYARAETARKVIEAPTATSDSKLAEQEAILARYSWVDKENGVTSIPIERAMRLVADELRVEQRRLEKGVGNERN